jgi:hypothetical protein
MRSSLPYPTATFCTKKPGAKGPPAFLRLDLREVYSNSSKARGATTAWGLRIKPVI